MKYSDLLCQWLAEYGYTHCFTVAGGNIMHITESASRYFHVIPVVHEVAAGIAAEYFNESETGKRAFALVTAGPGLTNIITAMAGAYLESRDLLVIGGQVKTSDLSYGSVRQRGIQEIDGVALTQSVTACSICLTGAVDKPTFLSYVQKGLTPRKAPVFIELPLDIQAREVEEEIQALYVPPSLKHAAEQDIATVAEKIRAARYPVLLLGAGISRQTAKKIEAQLETLHLPIMLTWNAADRLASSHRLYYGRPNTWGQRYANILLQKSDLLVAVGSRLGMQQTGFNWQQFIPEGQIIQVDIDKAELQKPNPGIAMGIEADANDFIERLVACDLGNHSEWLTSCSAVKAKLPTNEKASNARFDGYLSPFDFSEYLSDMAGEGDIIVPCSSGGAFTAMMQAFHNKKDQLLITNKALAAMGYGLSGAIGAAFASPGQRTILIEGDGGFTQNLQELAVVSVNRLNMKIFIFDNHGYASIRMVQRNYFNGKYIGCDVNTGLGFPDWQALFAAYDIPVMRVNDDFRQDGDFRAAFHQQGPAAFIVRIHPEQSYFPKITSRVTENGSMESNPLHMMYPEIAYE